MSPLARFLPAAAVLARLAFRCLLRLAVDLGEMLLGMRKVVPDGSELDGLLLAVTAPIAAVPSCPERCHLDDGVHGLEQVAVVTDDDRPAPPACEQVDH